MQNRILQFEGVRNFRDFGGYETADGGRVREGQLFRSAHFAEATDADIERIRALDIAFKCDLRRPEERKAQACRWPSPACATRVIASDDGGLDAAPHIAFLQRSDLTPESVRAFMRELYAEIPFDPRYVALFRSYFADLVKSDGPALVHCAAGKDRTGILCALTLLALDVPEEAIVEDYELTNRAVDLENRLPEIRQRFSMYIGRDLPEAAVLPFLGVEAVYLATAMDMIAKRCGDPHAYMRDVLGLENLARDKLRERLVE
ncbi:MAG: tyrosine-protein phosphatase [Hydrogenophilaceae bacterium]|jgi:protein-tyrosine phosphatase|nr:tyrosine-protein phosphatase [Hydrogenophilaceae bacterium]